MAKKISSSQIRLFNNKKVHEKKIKLIQNYGEKEIVSLLCMCFAVSSCCVISSSSDCEEKVGGCCPLDQSHWFRELRQGDLTFGSWKCGGGSISESCKQFKASK